MFDNEIILENLSRTMEMEDQILNNDEKEVLKGILDGKNSIDNTLESIKKTYL